MRFPNTWIKNGKLFLMLDPSVNSAEEPNQGLIGLMDRWGVTIGNDLVFDRIRPAFFLFGGSQPDAPTLSDFEFHQITQEVYRQVTFQLARSVTPKTNVGSNLNIKSLVKTTDEIGGSWGETKRKADGTFETDLSYTEGEDTPPRCLSPLLSSAKALNQPRVRTYPLIHRKQAEHESSSLETPILRTISSFMAPAAAFLPKRSELVDAGGGSDCYPPGRSN